jgi:hypothetical protein
MVASQFQQAAGILKKVRLEKYADYDPKVPVVL